MPTFLLVIFLLGIKRKTVREMQVENVHCSQTFLTARCCCAIFAYIISGQDGENNGIPPSFLLPFFLRAVLP